jgi:hypothetical protein
LETEQAHSLQGSSGAPPRRDLRTGGFSRTAQRAVPAIWLNLVCFDAPLVAVVWLLLFARTFEIPLQKGNCLALFLTGWLIYLADRLVDAISLKPEFPRSHRQQFCLRHREIWVATVLLLAGFDAYVIWRSTAFETFLVGAVVGVLALIYLVINHPLGLVWRSLPAKELVIGFLFTAGTLVALTPAIHSLTRSFVAAALAFAALCGLNCISIANWELELDRAQKKVSIATRHPAIAGLTGVICVSLAIVSAAIGIANRGLMPLMASLSLSALFLAWLNSSHARLNRDTRTALADLVLLTPIVPLIAMGL